MKAMAVNCPSRICPRRMAVRAVRCKCQGARYLSNELLKSHKGLLLSMPHCSFCLSEPCTVKNREEGAPSKTEFRIRQIRIRGQRSMIRKREQVMVVGVRDGLLATFE